MQAIKGRDSKIELEVRRIIFKAGFRYRLHGKKLPGKPDLVFTRQKKVIFVHGCFWHCHPDPSCKIAHRPASNTTYWHPKLEKTLERDKKNLVLLQDEGWKVLVVWECQMKDCQALAASLLSFMES